MKNIVCIIARTNSTRLPQKTIREVGGRKLIEHIIDSMKELRYADKIYLCTSTEDSDKILLDIAHDNGICSYAGSPLSVIDRILDVAELEKADNVLRVTGDNIFTDPIFLDYALKCHMEHHVDYTRVERLPLGVTGEVMKVSALKKCYMEIDPDKSEYLAFYMFDPDKYKCLTILPPERFHLPFKTLTVDTPEDWERTKYIFDNLKKQRIYMGDIEMLSRNSDIPFYDLSENSQIKLPENRRISYREFRTLYESKIEKSLQCYLEEKDYDNECAKRH